MGNIKFFGREPALFTGLLAVVLQLATGFGAHLTGDQQALVNAVAAALVGVAVAVVAHDSLSAPVLGLTQAAVAVAVGFGLHWTVEQQGMVMAVASALVALFVRQQVTAPVGAPTTPQRFG